MQNTPAAIPNAAAINNSAMIQQQSQYQLPPNMSSVSIPNAVINPTATLAHPPLELPAPRTQQQLPPNMPGPSIEGKNEHMDNLVPPVMLGPDVMNIEGGSKDETLIMNFLRYLATYVYILGMYMSM